MTDYPNPLASRAANIRAMSQDLETPAWVTRSLTSFLVDMAVTVDSLVEEKINEARVVDEPEPSVSDLAAMRAKFTTISDFPAGFPLHGHRLRYGKHYMIHVYQGDTPVATAMTGYAARRIVYAVNRVIDELGCYDCGSGDHSDLNDQNRCVCCGSLPNGLT